MPTNFDIPVCPNSIEGQFRCAKSDTFVERETDGEFVIRCRTCQTINIWPKEKDESKARYEAGLRKLLLKRQKEDFHSRQREYSYKGAK